MNSFLAKINAKIGTVDLNNLSFDEYKKIIELVDQENISSQDFIAFVQMIPNIVSLSKAFLEHLNKVVDGIQSSQKHNLEYIKSNLMSVSQVMVHLSKQPHSEQLIPAIQILASIHIETQKIIQQMNKDNNETWLKFTTIVATSILTILGLVLANRKR